MSDTTASDNSVGPKVKVPQPISAPPGAGTPVTGTSPDPKFGRHASEWGLASLLCSGMLLVCAPVIALLALTLGDVGRRTMGQTDVVLAIVGASVTTAVVLALLLAS